MSNLIPRYHVLHRSGFVGEIQTQVNPGEPGLYPDCVAENDPQVNQILADWEGFVGLEPSFITNMRMNQRTPDHNWDHGDDNMLLPPGVE